MSGRSAETGVSITGGNGIDNAWPSLRPATIASATAIVERTQKGGLDASD
jgi:hypothetical protein